MFDFSTFSLFTLIGLFAVSALIVLVCGVALTRKADEFGQMTGIGGAITGAVLLGANTSLSGSITSVTAAVAGHPELAMSNAIGGIAAQTVFLVVADIAYRKANLEHSAASVPNMIMGTILIILLTLMLMAIALPSLAIWHIHPVTPLLFALYLGGVKLAHEARENPAWTPFGNTRDLDQDDQDNKAKTGALGPLLFSIAILGVICAAAGWLIATTGVELAAQTGIREGVVGLLLTSVATSLPELVTTVAAVRRGALTMAVGGILGGNTFDVLFAAFSDIGYQPGSIYHAVGGDQVFMICLSIVMTAILILGLLRRERSGPANIGLESSALLLVYLVGIGAVVFAF